MVRLARAMGSSEFREQRIQALGLANAVRSGRARLKREIRDGATTIPEVLRTPPPEADRCTLRELLISQRGWGRSRCTSFLAHHEISEHKLLADLTDRQRELLARDLTTPA